MMVMKKKLKELRRKRKIKRIKIENKMIIFD
jgi:hypothetical protein